MLAALGMLGPGGAERSLAGTCAAKLLWNIRMGCLKNNIRALVDRPTMLRASCSLAVSSGMPAQRGSREECRMSHKLGWVAVS
jgi:hypothetical protein